MRRIALALAALASACTAEEVATAPERPETPSAVADKPSHEVAPPPAPTLQAQAASPTSAPGQQAAEASALSRTPVAGTGSLEAALSGLSGSRLDTDLNAGSGGLGLRGSGAGGGSSGNAVFGTGRVGTRGRGVGEAGYGAGEGGLGNKTDRDFSVTQGSAGIVGKALQGGVMSGGANAGGEPPSPGGTFAHAGTNPVVQTSADRFSTFAIDVDTGSWFYAKRFLENQSLPTPGAVRVEELVNAISYDYAGPVGDDPFAIHVDAAPSPFGTSKTLLRVALQGQRISAQHRKPAHIVFLADVSGSMGSADRLPWVREGLHLMVDALRSDDSVAIVTYANGTDVRLPATRATDKARIHDAIDTLQSAGGTNMGSGLELAYREATKELGSLRSATVVVLSDGDANLGTVGYPEMLASIKGYVSEGVTMATVGFGSGNYNDQTMEQLADAGNGRYTYVGDRKYLRQLFTRDLVDGIEVIAEDVKIQVEMVPEHVKSYRLLGYENRDVADRDFRNDKKDAGEIFSGHAVTALYELELTGAARGDAPLAHVRVRAKKPRHPNAEEQQQALLARDVKPSVEDLDADARAAVGMALAAEVLRVSTFARGKTLADAAAMLESSAKGPFAEERADAARILRLGSHLPRTTPEGATGSSTSQTGSLPRGVVDRVVREHAAQTQDCYERELARTPGLTGIVVMKWVIDDDGTVANTQMERSMLENARMEACLAAKIKTWTFPKPQGAGVVLVRYPFRFAPPA